MALCRRGGLRAPRGTTTAASSHAAAIAAAASLFSRGGDAGQSAATSSLAGKIKRDWQRHGAAYSNNLLHAGSRRYSFVSGRAGETTALSRIPPFTGTHASSGKRFYPRMPAASPASAANWKSLKTKDPVEASPTLLQLLPYAFSRTSSEHRHLPSTCGSLTDPRVHGAMYPSPPGSAGAATGGTNYGQQHHLFDSFIRGRKLGSQHQLRGFSFPSLKFFANSGASSSSENVARASTGGSSSNSVTPQQLRLLQQQAEANLENAELQERYLAALNANGESYRAVQHVEKYKDNLQGMSEAVLVEYVKALCNSGLINQQGRSILQVVQRYVAEGGGRMNDGDFKGDAARDVSASSSLTSLLQQHQTQQQQLLQQQLTVQLQQLVHQLQVEGAQRRAASTSPLNSSVDEIARTAGHATEGEIVKLARAATAASAAVPLTGWRRYSPLRVIKWFCRGLWGLLKACNRGLWGVLLSPVVAVFLFWSFLNDGVHAVQNSVKNMEGTGALGSQAGGKKASEWVAGKVVKPEEVNTTFADVKGCEEVKKEVVEVVEYLKAPAKFTAMGARLPKGVLLQGPPGTGKTLLARAIAGEAGVPFIHASGSDFEEMYVGVGASRLRQLFAEARKRSPCILFIDEIDALGGRRTLTENKHHRQTLNQLLTELDGFKPAFCWIDCMRGWLSVVSELLNTTTAHVLRHRGTTLRMSDGVTLICATNLAEALDPALTRPGRIDRIIHVPLPCKKERIDILQHYAMKMPLAEDVDLDLLASLTSGMTGADLANLLNFAAIRAATEGKVQVTLAEVEESFDRLMVGNRRSSVVMKEEERKVTAYHESGHALMCLYTPGSLPLHKATILFRGSALGVTWSVNREESFSKSLKEYLASLDVAMGGKAAEEIVFGKGNVTSGCFNDLQKATRVARNMVTGFGMGVEDSRAPMVVSGKEYSFLSDESKKKVDEAVQRLLDQSYERARALLTEKRDELERLAQALLEHETLTADEIRATVSGTIDSAAIKERRRQKAAAAQVPKPKVKSGDEGEGEEEQQPPSALLRSGGDPSECAVKRVDTRGSQERSQARAAASSDLETDASSSSPTPPAIDLTQSIKNCSAGTQGEIASDRTGDSKEIFVETPATGTTTESSLASDTSDPYSAPATVSAVSALLAAAVGEPRPEQHMEKQQPSQRTANSEETFAPEKSANKAEGQKEKTDTIGVSEQPPDAENFVDRLSGQNQHDTTEVKTKLLSVEDAEKCLNTPATQKTQTDGGAEGKKVNFNAGKDDKAGGSV